MNASFLEWVWTIAMGISFVGTDAALVVLWWRYYNYRKPHPVTHKRANGLSIWLYRRDAILYGVLAILTGMFTLLGRLAMDAPEPIRPEGQRMNEITAAIFIGIAVLVAVGVIANLWIGLTAFRGGKQ